MQVIDTINLIKNIITEISHFKKMNNYDFKSKIEIIIEIILKYLYLKYFNYKGTCKQLYSDSNYNQGEMKQSYGNVIHF